MNTFRFLLLSAITGLVEVGSVLYAILQGYSVVQILAIVLAYQIGCFFPKNISLKRSLLFVLCVFSILSNIAFYFNIDNWWLLAFSILFLSPCIQSLRSVLKSSINVGIKRGFRIVGFAFAPLFSVYSLLIISLLCLVFLIDYNQNNINGFNFVPLKWPYMIMIVHQIHYFSYTYIVLFIIRTFDMYYGWLTSFIFVLGWITYTAVPYVLRKRKYTIYLISGHIFLFFIILSMALTQSSWLFSILWILTGFGGGTVFCIKEILKKNNCYEETMLETAENYGHVLGVLFAMLIYSIFSLLAAPIIFAAICAILTVILTLIFEFYKRGEKKYD